MVQVQHSDYLSNWRRWIAKDAGRAGMLALASSPLHGGACLLLTHSEPSEIKQWQCRAYSTKPPFSISKHTLTSFRFFFTDQLTQSAWPPILVDFTLPLFLRTASLSCRSIYIYLLDRRDALQQHLQQSTCRLRLQLDTVFWSTRNPTTSPSHSARCRLPT